MQGTGFSPTDQAQQAQNAINAGADPGTVQTLVALGATPGQLALVAQGNWNPAIPGTANDSAVQLLNYLTGNTPLPGQSVAAANELPESTDPQSDLIDQASSAVVDTANAAASALSPLAGIPSWVWWVGGGLAAFIVFKGVVK
jgi:hypothetical protein